ncbi:glycosyltransferase [Myxacorys almedinensis]|uniref:Glycosyltransferase n=1 Tax=Myxacorys almedinensis A TaxID=2690445 RepID=A0A8J8CHG3_9CYAN|nr:glycosyltransferase [Myxacorys almedinensis]NDJ16624.1 glycosyltransferase [Myxacorys almedinensis A]
MKVALVHDYLTQRGGAERVFELLCKRYPDADVFTSLYDPQLSVDLGDRIVNTTYLQRLPKAPHYFKLLAPFYYAAFRALDLRDYDLIISSTTSFAKAVRKRPDAKHICFCHNVTRFLWDTKTYLREYSAYRRFYPLLENIFQLMRRADLAHAQEPDLYVANSSTVAQRIEKIYNRPALVINYPIDSQQFTFSDQKENFYLASARLLSYKRIDVIVEAFNWLGWTLLVTGEGPEREALQSRAMKNVKFLGHVSDSDRKWLLSRSRSVIVTALEDYGLVPIEANASGTPVIAFGEGGVLDTQIPGTTGVFFKSQTPHALYRALLQAASIPWDYQTIRNHALSHFSEEVFFQSVERVIGDACGTG